MENLYNICLESELMCLRLLSTCSPAAFSWKLPLTTRFSDLNIIMKFFKTNTYIETAHIYFHNRELFKNRVTYFRLDKVLFL